MPYENVPCWIREMIGHLETQEMCDKAVHIKSRTLAWLSDQYKAQAMCKKAVCQYPYSLAHVPDHFMAQEICNEAICENPATFVLVPDSFKGEQMCINALEVDSWERCDVPDYLKTQKIYDDVVRMDSYSLQFVSDWFVTLGLLKEWHNDDDYYNDDEPIEWYNGYKKRKVQKAKIKEETLLIAWHPNCVMDWCVSEDEKRLWFLISVNQVVVGIR